MKAQAGVGLVEVLVALLIFAVGIVGAFKMQIAAKRANFEAAQQSIAVGLVRDILERIRSNPGELESYLVEEVGERALAAGLDCRLMSCSNSQLAVHDLHEWSSHLTGAGELVSIDGTDRNAGGLAMARACVRRSSRIVTVAIAWRGTNRLAGDSESDCGESSSVYGAGNEGRRLLVMTTYIGSL